MWVLPITKLLMTFRYVHLLFFPLFFPGVLADGSIDHLHKGVEKQTMAILLD